MAPTRGTTLREMFGRDNTGVSDGRQRVCWTQERRGLWGEPAVRAALLEWSFDSPWRIEALARQAGLALGERALEALLDAADRGELEHRAESLASAVMGPMRERLTSEPELREPVGQGLRFHPHYWPTAEPAVGVPYRILDARGDVEVSGMTPGGATVEHDVRPGDRKMFVLCHVRHVAFDAETWAVGDPGVELCVTTEGIDDQDGTLRVFVEGRETAESAVYATTLCLRGGRSTALLDPEVLSEVLEECPFSDAVSLVADVEFEGGTLFASTARPLTVVRPCVRVEACDGCNRDQPWCVTGTTTGAEGLVLRVRLCSYDACGHVEVLDEQCIDATNTWLVSVEPASFERDGDAVVEALLEAEDGRVVASASVRTVPLARAELGAWA